MGSGWGRQGRGRGWPGVGLGLRELMLSGATVPHSRLYGAGLLVPGRSPSMSPRGQRVDPHTSFWFHENHWFVELLCRWHVGSPVARGRLSNPENRPLGFPSIIPRSDPALSRWSGKVQPEMSRAKPLLVTHPHLPLLQARNSAVWLGPPPIMLTLENSTSLELGFVKPASGDNSVGLSFP